MADLVRLGRLGGGSGDESGQADMAQRLRSRSAMGGSCGLLQAWSCSPFQVKRWPGFFLFGGSGGTGNRRLAVRWLSGEVLKGLVVIFCSLGGLSAVVIGHVSLLYVSAYGRGLVCIL